MLALNIYLRAICFLLSNQLASFKRPLIQTQLGWETSNKKEWGANAELRVEVKYKLWPRHLISRTTSNSCLHNWSWSGEVPELFRLRQQLSQQLAYGKRDPLPLPTNTEQDPEDQSILGSVIYSGILLVGPRIPDLSIPYTGQIRDGMIFWIILRYLHTV